jgi:RimJ/RimL family protein N-acetyltransferase
MHLEVEDLVLRPWNDPDADAIASAYQEDPEIPRRTGFAYGLTVDQAQDYIAERRRSWNAGVTAAFGIFDHEGCLLGSISLLQIDRQRGQAQIAFWLARGARGHGVATRAVNRIVTWAAELGLTLLTATVEVTNDPSRRVLERAHFDCLRIARRNRKLHGRWIDEYVYEIRVAG